jgi:hypothetical protein
MSTRRHETAHATLLALLALLVGACAYDLDKIYEHSVVDAGMNSPAGDASAPDAAEPEQPTSTHLIAAWGRYPTVDRECIECAEAQCAQANDDCRADKDCEAYTQCVGATPNPKGQASCRARYGAWVGAEKIRDRDLGGPYGQCVFRDKCAAQCDGNNDLACINQYTWPSSSEQNIPFRLILIDAQVQTKVLPGVRVKVCGAGETSCATPQGEGVTDERGGVDLMLPTLFNRSFTGYLELSGTGIYPTLIKFGWNIGDSTTQVVSIVDDALFRLSINLISSTLDPTRGMLQLRMLGCGGVGVRGVSFSADRADAQTKYWYLADGIPSLTEKSTNNVGSGGIIDLPAGYTKASAMRASDNVLVAETNVPVRAGYMTVVVFSPLAAP